MPAPVITLGVDLAAQPAKTATAMVFWHDGTATVESVAVKQNDAQIVSLAAGARMIGIDSPLGWPDAFVDFVARQRDGLPVADQAAAKQNLVLRRTDHFVKDEFGLRPLSVSADLIGHVAIRAVGLLDQLRDAGIAVDRSGVTGRVAETYPAGAVKQWLPEHRRYKGPANSAVRKLALHQLTRAVPLKFARSADRNTCVSVDHAFDALLCALVARAVLLKKTARPPASLRALAKREGWIAVPTCNLSDLSVSQSARARPSTDNFG